MAESQIPVQKRRPSRWFHLVALALVAAGLFGGYKAIVAAIHMMEGAVTQAIFPGAVVVQFSVPGEYEIYYESESEFGGRVFDTGSSVPGLAFTVTNDETGDTIPLHRPTISETYTMNGRSGSAVLQFHITKPGRYKVEAHYDDNDQHEDTVFAVGNIRFGRFALLIVAGIFSVLFVGGAGLLLIALIEIWRYSSNRKLQASPLGPGSIAPTPPV